MKSSELFQTQPKPAENVPVNPQNPAEPEEPVSTRQPNMSQRGDDFRNTQEPVNEPAPIEPEGNEQVLTVEEMLEMEDAELKSYGIDDPKTWKSYQRLLHKKEVEWKEREKLYKEALAGKVKPPVNEPLPPQQQQNAPLRPPVKPQRPADYDYTLGLSDPTSESGRYLTAMEMYREQKDAYQDAMIANLTGYVNNEQQTKIQQRRREEVKSMSLSRFQQRGLNAQEASSLFEKIEQAYMADAETGADIFVSLFKGGNVNGKNTIPANAGKRKLPENIILPPGVNTSTAKPVESTTKSFMRDLEGRNQSRKIILNREKRK